MYQLGSLSHLRLIFTFKYCSSVALFLRINSILNLEGDVDLRNMKVISMKYLLNKISLLMQWHYIRKWPISKTSTECISICTFVCTYFKIWRNIIEFNLFRCCKCYVTNKCDVFGNRQSSQLSKRLPVWRRYNKKPYVIISP